MKITLTDIERESYKDSTIHRLDGRIKILVVFTVILYAVALPRIHELNFTRLAFIELYLIAILMLAKLNPMYVLLRFIAALPFGAGIAVLQPFIRQPFIESFTQYPVSLPFGLTMTYEGMEFGAMLLAKFIVCITSIILLSSTTQMKDMVESARRLGLPEEFTLLLTMMIRYLFIFWAMLKRINTAQKARLFSIWNKNVSRRWILEQIAHSISSLFLRSYEQGERTYISMLCRGYSNTQQLYRSKKKLGRMDIIFFVVTIGLIFSIHMLT
ncbi:MAG TPA: cobalt ECF transporter T component CbiQ [Methanosarcinaceae archaeon]|nr:cobalt ECF transporter T component CbiQ [Methanosarcinaceae archaeon]